MTCSDPVDSKTLTQPEEDPIQVKNENESNSSSSSSSCSEEEKEGEMMLIIPRMMETRKEAARLHIPVQGARNGITT